MEKNRWKQCKMVKFLAPKIQQCFFAPKMKQNSKEKVPPGRQKQTKKKKNENNFLPKKIATFFI